MPLAILASIALNSGQIDEENNVIRGVRLAELGKLAVFRNGAGDIVTTKISPAHVDKLLGFATEQGRLSTHWTHDWLLKENQEKDPLGFRAGHIDNARKDEAGNLVADLHLMPNEFGKMAMHMAKKDPRGIMLSPVYGYDKSDKDCIPENFRAADLVETGAATTALMAAVNPEPEKKTMDINELIAALKDPSVCTAIKAMVKDAESKQPDDSAMSDDDTAAMAAAFGVTDADKKPEDDKLNPKARAYAQMARATERKNAEALVKAEAKFSGTVGANVKAMLNAARGGDDGFEAAVTAAMVAGAKTRGVAIMRVAKDKPELYAAREQQINKR